MEDRKMQDQLLGWKMQEQIITQSTTCTTTRNCWRRLSPVWHLPPKTPLSPVHTGDCSHPKRRQFVAEFGNCSCQCGQDFINTTVFIAHCQCVVSVCSMKKFPRAISHSVASIDVPRLSWTPRQLVTQMTTLHRTRHQRRHRRRMTMQRPRLVKSVCCSHVLQWRLFRADTRCCSVGQRGVRTKDHTDN